MNDVIAIINLLTTTEKQKFIRFLDKKNKRHDTRNITLFSAIDRGEADLIRQEIGTNAFNVLKKRLMDNLIDFLANLSLEQEASLEVQLMKRILVVRKLLDNQLEKKGFKLLKRAEDMAIEIGQLTLLNEIYHTYVEYSHLPEAPDQEEIFEKLKRNTEQFMEQERLNMVYAMVKKAFSENTTKDIDLDMLINEAFVKFGGDSSMTYTYKLLSQIAQIADIVAEMKKDYSAIDLFFVEKLELLERRGERRHPNYRVELIYHIANIYFRRRDFRKCKIYLDRLEQIIDPKLNPKHYVKYRNLEALYYNYTGNYGKALDILDPILNNNSHDDTMNPRLVVVMIELQQGNYNAARKHLFRLTHSDRWYESTIGIDWTLHKKFLEIILLIELQESTLLESRIQSLDRTYGQILKSGTTRNAYNFLRLIKKMVNKPHIVESDEFRLLVDKTIIWRPKEREDLFMMSFYAWLKAKMEKRNVYEVTLELVSDN